MRDNVVAGLPTWTNNNCESINHVLKQADVQWRPNQLPDLVDKIRALVRGQYDDEADRALCGRGDFTLSARYAGHRLTVERWKSMSSLQRDRASAACLHLLPPVTTSTSTDGNVTVPTTPGGGKKPHQRRRQRAVRTNTDKTAKRAKVADTDANS
jgi:hypothetical protein